MAWFRYGSSHIYYEETGRGEPVVLLPGFGGSIAEFVALRDALIGANYRVITADLPGSGRSMPQPRVYTRTYFEDDAHLFADFLEYLEVRTAHLMGYRDGGEVALLMAVLYPSLARSVVTWGAGGRVIYPENYLRDVAYNIIDHPTPALQAFRDELVNTYGEANARAMTQSRAAALIDIIKGGGDICLSKAKMIACPVLLIAGNNDQFLPFRRFVETLYYFSNSSAIVPARSGHDVHRAQGAWLAQTVCGWLSDY